jgi:penicillin-binding protein 1A
MAVGRREASARRRPAADPTRIHAPHARSRRRPPKQRNSRRGRGHAAEAAALSAAGANGGDRGGRGRRFGFGRIIYWGAVLGLWAIIAAIGLVVWVGAHLPPIQSLEIPKRPPSIQIAGSDSRVLVTRGDMGAEAVSLKELPNYLPKAFVAIEDRRFYSHYGIDPTGVARAAAANVLRRSVQQGGSTITQQLAKNLFLTQERTWFRKMQEVVLALWLERKFSKAEILELYLNRIYFGAGAYGIEAAAQRYFKKTARQLTLAEAALLAGLVKSPSRLAPTRNPDGAQRRAQTVLTAMADTKLITGAMAKLAMAQPARAVKPAGAGSINYVADWIMDVLDDLVGRVEQDIVVVTSIDPVLQAVAEKTLVDELAQRGEKFDVEQGAIVAMTPDGAVRALVGGRNYAESQFNRAVSAKRQPGSAFKPFVYLAALERGLTPETIRDDRPINVKGWRPENYTREYFGPVTLTQALAHSLNTVSVRLTLEVGASNVARTAHRLGIASRLAANTSIALGTSEISLIELTGAYAVFANGGAAVAPHVVERVRTADGKVLYERTPPNLGRVVEPPQVAMMNAMMQETILSGTGRKAALGGWPAAGKTGTSQDFRDAWFIGYTANLVTGVWLGNDDSSPSHKATGSGLPVDIWSKFMKTAHQGVAVAGLPGLTGGMTASAAPPAPSANVPPAPVNAPKPPANTGSLDHWLLDRLFGRR